MNFNRLTDLVQLAQCPKLQKIYAENNNTKCGRPRFIETTENFMFVRQRHRKMRACFRCVITMSPHRIRPRWEPLAREKVIGTTPSRAYHRYKR